MALAESASSFGIRTGNRAAPEGYPRVNSEEGASSDRTLAQSSHLSPARVALLWPGAKAVHAASPTQVTCAEQDASGRDHSTRRARRDP
jgi:hypothetical protein